MFKEKVPLPPLQANAITIQWIALKFKIQKYKQV